jgi:hypothetical protein
MDRLPPSTVPSLAANPGRPNPRFRCEFSTSLCPRWVCRFRLFSSGLNLSANFALYAFGGHLILTKDSLENYYTFKSQKTNWLACDIKIMYLKDTSLAT